MSGFYWFGVVVFVLAIVIQFPQKVSDVTQRRACAEVIWERFDADGTNVSISVDEDRKAMIIIFKDIETIEQLDAIMDGYLQSDLPDNMKDVGFKLIGLATRTSTVRNTYYVTYDLYTGEINRAGVTYDGRHVDVPKPFRPQP